MTTNHKPATALPWYATGWHQEQDSAAPSGFRKQITSSYAGADGHLIAGLGGVPYVAEIRAKRSAHYHNAAYIVHAANAYPRLVETLRDLQARCDKLIFRPALDDARTIDQDIRALREGLEAPRALLSELGEAN